MNKLYLSILLLPALAVAEPLTCHTEVSCKAAMDAARSWLDAHTGMQFRALTDDYIETWAPRNAAPFRFAGKATRVRISKDNSTIELQLACGAEINAPTGGLFHIKARPCEPDGDTMRTDFFHTVEQAIVAAEK